MRGRRTARFMVVVVLGVALAGAGCRGAHPAPGASATSGETAGPSLYTRLGGGDAIKAVVHDFVSNVASDTRINHYFQDADLPHLESQLSNLIGQASGGPEKYEGQDMRAIHAGMGINSADFDALVADLVTSLDAHHVGASEKTELLGILGGMKGVIVEK